MTRFLLVIAATAILLVLGQAAAVSQPQPPMKEETLYFPTTVGDTAIYVEGDKEVTETVTKVEDVDGSKIVSVDRGLGAKVITPNYLRVKVSAKGVAVVQLYGTKFDPLLWELQLPAKVGSKWTFERDADDGKYFDVRVIDAVEAVEVPAGRYMAVKVVRSRTLDNRPFGVKWYAQRVGLVKSEFGKETKVLKSFTPGAAGGPARPKDGPMGMKFVSLPKGTFYMSGGKNQPGRKTEIRENFEIAVHTVTQEQWQALMGKNPSYFSRAGEGKDKVKDVSDEELKQFPVERVSWNDAQEFIKKLNEKEKGKNYRYRLPTEAEWEYACRGGATSKEECSYDYYLARPTNVLSSKDANFNGTADKGPFLGRTSKVGSYTPNKIGLYDMHGNVRQWCQDGAEQAESSVHISRGGAWYSFDFDCRAWDRYGSPATQRFYAQGLRVVRVSVP